MRYSQLSQVNRENVDKLKVAFQTGDISQAGLGRKASGFETTPIMLDGKLIFTTPFNRIIALDPETGKLLWAYDFVERYSSEPRPPTSRLWVA